MDYSFIEHESRDHPPYLCNEETDLNCFICELHITSDWVNGVYVFSKQQCRVYSILKELYADFKLVLCHIYCI